MPARPGASRRRLAVAAVVLAGALLVPLRLSADVWAYAAYGALLAHGVDPWSHAIGTADAARLGDPLVDAALRAWDGSIPRDVYGPLFTLPCALVVLVTRGLGTGAAIAGLRLLAAAALLGCIALAGRRRPWLAGSLAVHPVVLWGAAEGHNDAFWLALVLAADHLGEGPRRFAALTAAAAVKAVAVVPLAAAALWLPVRRRARVLAWGAAALLLAYGPLLWSVVAHGLDHGAGPPRISLLHGPALAAWSGSPVPLAAAALLAAGGAAGVARAARAGEWTAALALGAWLALPSPEPWYALWLVAAASVLRRSPARGALLVASVTGTAGYVQDIVAGTQLAGPALLGGTMFALYALPVLVALLQPAPAPGAPQPQPPPAATAQPAAPGPAPTPAASTTPVPPPASPTPNPFGYIVTPAPGPAGAPRFLEIALNDRVLHKGGMLLVRISTSPDVTTVVGRTMGREIAVPQGAPGYFAGQEQLPSGIPFFLLGRTYQVDFVATTADGRTTTVSLPIRLER